MPNTTGRFSLIQLADEYGVGGASLTTSQIDTEAPHYDAVWAAFQPNVWVSARSSAGLGPMILSQYAIPFEDNYLISGCNLQCWQSAHPDWIMYACDSNGNPTTNLPWSTSGFPNDVPLNIDNPSVVSYELNQVFLPYMQSHNLNAIAIDQVTFENFLDWGLATYAMADEGGLGLYVAPQGVGQYSYRSEFSDAYGSPCSAMSEVGTNLYVERFSAGLAIVNAGSSAQSYTLPANHTYTDIEQNHLNVPGAGGSVTVNGADGAMLLMTSSGNGCS